jgi:hypothetical protein
VFKRKIYRILLIILLWFLRLLAIGFIVFQSASIQTWLTEHVITFMANRYEIKIEIESVEVKLPNHLVLNELYIPDQTGDTLVYSKEILVKISAVKLRDKRIYISEVLLDEPKICVESDSAGVFNFQFLLDKFASDKEKEPSGEGFDIFCESFLIQNACLKMQNNPFTETPESLNTDDLLVDGFTLRINDFQMYDGSIALEMNEFAFMEKSGMELQKMSGYFEISDSLYHVSNLFLKTGNSMIHAPVMQLAVLDTSMNNIWEDLQFDIQIDSSMLGIKDAVFFAPDLKGLDNKVHMRAELSGTLADIKLKDFIFTYGRDTRIAADISINGLPELEEAFIFGEIKELTSSVRDAQSIYIPPFDEKKTLQLPENVQKLGTVKFQGDLVGMFNDIVANGKFTTDYGSITTDLAVVSDIPNKRYNFNGDISVNALQIGEILDKTEMLGELDMSANLNGSFDSLGQYDIAMGSKVSRMDFNQYSYSEINLAGRLTNKSFNGEIMIDDPNIKLEFMGGYLIKNNIPKLDFRADLLVNLDELNFDTTDTEAGLLLIADMQGRNLNDALGELQLSNIYYRKEQDTARINTLVINSLNILDEQVLQIESEYFDISTSGSYDSGDLLSALSTMVYQYFPVLSDDEEKPEDWMASNPGVLKIDAKFFNLDELTAFFLPQLSIPHEISLSANLNANKDIYDLEIYSPEIQFDTITSKNLLVSLSADKEILFLDINADYLNFKGSDIFNNLSIETASQKDSVFIALSWDNLDDSIRYAGNLSTSVLFEKSLNDNIALVTQLYPSDFILNNQEWKLDEARIRIDTTEINLGAIQFYNEKQMIKFVGDISNDPAKDLRYYIQNFDVSLLNRFLEQSGYKIHGIFNSNGRLADAYNNINFRSFIDLQKLYINEEEFGMLQINATWDYLSNALKIDGNSKYLDFRGGVNPTNDSINVTVNINNFGLAVLEPYMIDAGLLDIKGSIDGSIDVTGKLSDPDIIGVLDFNRAGLTYDMLMARFNLNDTVFVYTDSLVFQNFLISDEAGGKGVIKGKLTHNKFQNIKYDFDIDMINYHIMNTTEVDNSQYYGSAFATATANISGGTEDIVINIPEALTEKNTVFVLPMSDNYEADDEPWISFISDSATSENIEDLIPETPFDVTFLMNLSVTPDAEARIVFDPKVGDMIRANALGDLSIEVYPDGDFSMKGELEIKSGDYLFTLQNIINKRFVIQDGGMISWDGDPLDGKLDLEAAYKLKAPLYDIMIGIDTSDVYKRRTDVLCIMKMSGSLMNPDIKFSIEVPNADEKAKTRVASLSDDEINKQVLTLLVLNRFYTPDDMQMAGDSRGSNLAGVTSFELLSNQLSNWLSQISDDFDIGVNYRPGDEITTQELEVALSTQILNDRVLINGNVGVGEHENTSSDIVGDVEVQVKINKSGNLRVKGFTRANAQSQLEFDYGPYTQGVGIFYTESFNTIRGLLKRYFSFAKKPEETETKKLEETEIKTP